MRVGSWVDPAAAAEVLAVACNNDAVDCGILSGLLHMMDQCVHGVGRDAVGILRAVDLQDQGRTLAPDKTDGIFCFHDETSFGCVVFC